MALKLRPYQIDLIDKARALMRNGVKRILIVAPTGAGKTALTANMLGGAAEKGMGSWFIVHRRELVKQSIHAFAAADVNYGVIAAGFPAAPRPLVQLCSIQTLGNRLQHVRHPRLIVWDECHHVAAGGWTKIFKQFPDAFHVGVTATPQRLDGKGLGSHFQEMVEGPTVSWLIENGYLSKYKLFAPPSASTQGLHTRMGDFVKSELTNLFDKPTITGDAIREYQKRAPGKRAVVFCVSIEHSKHVVEQFKLAGIPAVHVDGETDAAERDQAIRDFANGRTRVLSNVDLFGEGFDLPSLEVAILLRPTQSLGLYLQQVGRVLRVHDGKVGAIILDHAGNCGRHGLPDETRQWSLDGVEGGNKSKGDGSKTSVRICPACFAAQFPGQQACASCGKAFPSEARQVQRVEGELVEVDAESLKRSARIEQGTTTSLEDLVKLGMARGYKRPRLWAKHVFNARQAKKRG